MLLDTIMHHEHPKEIEGEAYEAKSKKLKKEERKGAQITYLDILLFECRGRRKSREGKFKQKKGRARKGATAKRGT